MNTQEQKQVEYMVGTLKDAVSRLEGLIAHLEEGAYLSPQENAVISTITAAAYALGQSVDEHGWVVEK